MKKIHFISKSGLITLWILFILYQTTSVTAVSGFCEDEAFPVDYKVNVSVQDLLDGNDTYLGFIYDLLNERNQLARF